MSKKIKKLLFISLFFITFLSASTLPTIQFEIKTDFPKQNIWVKPLLIKSSKILNQLFLNKNVQIPNKIIVRIKKNRNLKGIGGNARKSDNSINFKSNLWQDDKYRRWIMIHELVNLLVSYYGSGAYPSDWWSNGRSPFPLYATAITLQKMGYKKDYLWLRNTDKNKPDQQFYWSMHKQYGTKLFKEFFHLLKNDDINLSKIGKKWPHPDKIRSLYTLTYLSLAAKKNLSKIARYYKIGKKPSDWHKRHPKIKFEEYLILKNEINEISELRKKLFMKNEGSYFDRRNYKLGRYYKLNL